VQIKRARGLAVTKGCVDKRKKFRLNSDLFEKEASVCKSTTQEENSIVFNIIDHYEN